MEKRREKHRIKQCIKCLEHSPSGSKTCAHCGEAFKRTKTTKILNKIKKFFDMVGQKKLGGGGK